MEPNGQDGILTETLMSLLIRRGQSKIINPHDSEWINESWFIVITIHKRAATTAYSLFYTI